MADMFGYDSNYTSTGLIRASDMILSVDGSNVAMAHALIQNIVIQYSQAIQIIREIGSRNYYYYAQPPNGSMNISRLVAADKGILSILPHAKTGTNIFQVPTNGSSNPNMGLRNISSAVGGGAIGGGVGGTNYTLKQCLVESLGINTDANSQFVQHRVVIRFGSLESA